VPPGELNPVSAAVKAEALKDDFRNFLWFLWRQLGLPDPTPVQYEIGYWLQHGPKRVVLEAFRGVGKSWITAVFVLWLLLRDPNERILIVSASKDRSDAMATFLKRLIHEVPLLKHLEPGPRQRDSSIMFDVGPAEAHQAPSVKSVGITGQMTGSRASTIVADDIETPKNSLTQTMRERLSELVKEFDAILLPGDDTRIIFLGTPQVEDTLYDKLPERGYEVRVWPARYPDVAQAQARAHQLAETVYRLVMEHPEVAGQPVDPDRFNEQDLMEREASYGRSGFALQFMLDTSPTEADRTPLKLGDILVFDTDPELAPVQLVWGSGPDQIIEGLPAVGLHGDRWHRPMHVSESWAPYTGSVMHIDPAGRGKDETSWAVIKYLSGKLFLVSSGGLHGGYTEENLRKLARVAKAHAVKTTTVEPNFGGGMFTELFKPVLQAEYPQCGVEDAEWAKGQKEVRIIETLEPVLNQHRLIVSPEVIRQDFRTEEPKYQLFFQLTRLTRDRGCLAFDDRVDALYGAVKYWVDYMARNQEGLEQEHKDRELDRELKKFLKHALGRKTRSKMAGRSIDL